MFMRLIRWPNLVFIFVTQLLFQYSILFPILRAIGIIPHLGTVDFLMIAAAYQLLAAAGYLINDYFDLSIDQVNKPDKIFIGRSISKNGALVAYILMNLLALVLSAYLGIKQGNPSLIICIAVSEVLLFCYSALFKKKFLIGNILVAVITASAIPVLIVTEPALANSQVIFSPSFKFSFITNITLIYTCFAIVISFARELVKDLEDVKGDSLYGGRTIPIVLGTRTANSLVVFSLLIVTGGLILLQPMLWQATMPGSKFLAVYSILLILCPLLWIISKVFRTATPEDYHRLSSYIKGVMLTGILSMLLIQYIIK